MTIGLVSEEIYRKTSFSRAGNVKSCRPQSFGVRKEIGGAHKRGPIVHKAWNGFKSSRSSALIEFRGQSNRPRERVKKSGCGGQSWQVRRSSILAASYGASGLYARNQTCAGRAGWWLSTG